MRRIMIAVALVPLLSAAAPSAQQQGVAHEISAAKKKPVRKCYSKIRDKCADWKKWKDIR